MDDVGTKALRWVRHERQVQRRRHTLPAEIREASQRGRGGGQEIKGWDRVEGAFQTEGSPCATVWRCETVSVPSGKRK